MYEFKHTPGPWTWTEDFPNSVDKNTLVGAEGRKVLDPVTGWDRGEIGIRTGEQDTGRPGTATPETAANARLIAAAPDLLAMHRNDIDMLHAIDVMCVSSKDYGYITEEIQAMIRRKWVLIKSIEQKAK